MAAALIGASMTSGVGLGLLLVPLSSNIVIRTACCSVGIALPVYSTFKAIEEKDKKEQERWLLYWSVYGSFSLAEVFSDQILSWFPPYYYMKFAFLVWLQFPSHNGSTQLYRRHLRPLLFRHQETLDKIVAFTNSNITKFISTYQKEILFVKAGLGRFVMAVSNLAMDVIQPGEPSGRAAIKGPERQVQDSEPHHDD
ncbi:HVA22-like protein k [Tasmannia lanceolata]|uniref:HVA22-like protein k n=1 Tax=Tasmannia lanceolata TaxID=3420 RepID=UPI0040634192